MKLRKTIKAILTIGLAAAICNAGAQSFPNPVRGNLSIKAGFEHRKTNFRWSIADSDGEPNIYSELIYNPIQSRGFYAEANYRIFKKLNISASFNRLTTYKGSATDIDYNGDNRTDYIPPQRGDTLFKSNNGNMQGYDISLRYSFIDNRIFEVGAGIAYHFSKELFYLRDDEMPDLNTTYLARWKAARFFLQATAQLNSRLYLGANVSYLPGRYDATANWNIQTDFQQPVSFIHQAYSNGWNYNANLGYRFSRHLDINIAWLHANWKTKTGLDRLFKKNGETPETQMNGAFKKSSGWQLTANYTF